MGDRSVPGVVASLSLVTVLIVFTALVSVFVPGAREVVFAEDRIVEWMTVLAFGAAFVLGVRRLRGSARRDLVLLAVTSLSGLAVLDELSFGERIFGWEAPRVLGTKLDAVHDLIRIGQKVVKRSTDHPYLVAFAVGLVLCVLLGRLAHWLTRRGWELVLGREMALVGGAILCLALAQGIDIDLRTLRADVLKPLYVEEVLELGAGLLLLSFAASRGRTHGPD